ncbi:hypothetical protein L3Q82_006617 [Scortum barcoo]|uniref:Uncharacterized protein n=1 Tax=Scortum barcoo TaxID=214431 RepID=A0ACB8X007_9TELE|nr:hypothetical protein L3Q82_006617 [Scortum barcoo]
MDSTTDGLRAASVSIRNQEIEKPLHIVIEQGLCHVTEQENAEDLSGSDHADTQDQTEGLISQESDTEPAVPAVSADISENEMSDDDATKQRLVVLLLTGLLLHTQKKARLSLCQEDLRSITLSLRDKALGEIKFADIVIDSEGKTVKRVYKALFGDLCRHFGCATALLKAVVSQDADDLVIQALKTHITNPNPTPKKNAVVRFFSSVGKVMAKPFTGCFSRRRFCSNKYNSHFCCDCNLHEHFSLTNTEKPQ